MHNTLRKAKELNQGKLYEYKRDSLGDSSKTLYKYLALAGRNSTLERSMQDIPQSLDQDWLSGIIGDYSAVQSSYLEVIRHSKELDDYGKNFNEQEHRKKVENISRILKDPKDGIDPSFVISIFVDYKYELYKHLQKNSITLLDSEFALEMDKISDIIDSAKGRLESVTKDHVESNSQDYEAFADDTLDLEIKLSDVRDAIAGMADNFSDSVQDLAESQGELLRGISSSIGSATNTAEGIGRKLEEIDHRDSFRFLRDLAKKS